MARAKYESDATKSEKYNADPVFRAKIQAQMREWYKANKDSVLARHRKNNYGLTQEKYLQLIADQNNQCLICKVEFSEKIRPAVDHCHVTGKVRGLLCCACNRGIGLFKDNPELLKAALSYLLYKGV